MVSMVRSSTCCYCPGFCDWNIDWSLLPCHSREWFNLHKNGWHLCPIYLKTLSYEAHYVVNLYINESGVFLTW